MTVFRLWPLLALFGGLLLAGCTEHEELPPAPPPKLLKPGERPTPPRPPAVPQKGAAPQ